MAILPKLGAFINQVSHLNGYIKGLHGTIIPENTPEKVAFIGRIWYVSNGKRPGGIAACCLWEVPEMR